MDSVASKVAYAGDDQCGDGSRLDRTALMICHAGAAALSLLDVPILTSEHGCVQDHVHQDSAAALSLLDVPIPTSEHGCVQDHLDQDSLACAALSRRIQPHIYTVVVHLSKMPLSAKADVPRTASGRRQEPASGRLCDGPRALLEMHSSG
ncbi:hypothetical protein OBBRIDRAFT_137598 [Obba rivulosa]|uniref:Uncharacterized protein n=1 Tax=Obba rivulosa TaxID=1052685 RepID=A0A8E2ASQ8_9APHY|nr:hypothetical protein OBBRIDRAFT_137598 [Obba rivulosa]